MQSVHDGKKDVVPTKTENNVRFTQVHVGLSAENQGESHQIRPKCKKNSVFPRENQGQDYVFFVGKPRKITKNCVFPRENQGQDYVFS